MRAPKTLFVLLLALFCFSGIQAWAQGPGKAAFMQAENLRRQKRYQEAIAKYDESLAQEAGNARYLFSKGKCYYSMKEYDLALSSLEEATQAKSDLTPAYSLIAKIYRRKNDNASAIYYYDQAFQNEGSKERKVQYKLEAVKLALKDGNIEEAKNHIREARGVDQENLNILYYDAKLSNKTGDYENAKDAMLVAASALENAPPAQSAKFYYELGFAFNNLNDYNNANKAWEKAYFGSYKRLIDRERSKNSPKFFYQKALSYYLAGQFDESQAELNRALELQNDFSAAYMLMGKMSKKQGNYTQAISHYQSAASMEQDPRRKTKLQVMLANMQLDAGDYSGALSTSNELLTGQGNNPRIMYLKALSQYHMGQYGSSITTLESMLGNPSLDNKSKAQYNFALGMAAKNTDVDKAKNAFKNAMYGPFKPAAKNELDQLLGNGNG